MEEFKKAMELAETISKENEAQRPDYEWMKIKHERKMQKKEFLRSVREMAKGIDSLSVALYGKRTWDL